MEERLEERIETFKCESQWISLQIGEDEKKNFDRH
jgi:hypothetical protein